MRTLIHRKDVIDNPSAYPVKCEDVSGKIHNGKILGVKNDFPVVCVNLLGVDCSFEFSFPAILRHLNSENQTYLKL